MSQSMALRPDRPIAFARIFAFALCLCQVSACTTASDVKEAITAFSTATGTATQALEAYDQAAAARATWIVRSRAIAKPVGVRTLDEQNENCATSSKRCRALFLEMTNDPRPEPLTHTTLMPNHVAAAKAIAAYGAALKEVADADATPQVTAALDKAAVTISSLANIVQPGTGTAVKAFTTPSANALAWIYGKYQEELKIKALRSATEKMDPIIREAAAKFDTVAALADLAGRTVRARALEDAMAAFEANQTPSTINALATTADLFDKELSAPVRSVFSNIAEAHHELTTALVTQPESLQDIYQALSKLVADAETLYNIAQAFKAAASSP